MTQLAVVSQQKGIIMWALLEAIILASVAILMATLTMASFQPLFANSSQEMKVIFAATVTICSFLVIVIFQLSWMIDRQEEMRKLMVRTEQKNDPKS